MSNGNLPQEGQQGPTFMDHYYLQFWLWGCLRDGESFLEAYANHRLVMRERSKFSSPLERRDHYNQSHMCVELTKYHFVATMGNLIRHLQRTHLLFPEIQPAYDQAAHLRTEGKDLRDMIEHADEYLAGGGRKPEKFIRTVGDVATNLPGDQPGISDATSMVVDHNGHWLGGRLNLERVLTEVRAIFAVAQKIPAPQSPRL
jgi:hypothetical protein